MNDAGGHRNLLGKNWESHATKKVGALSSEGSHIIDSRALLCHY